LGRPAPSIQTILQWSGCSWGAARQRRIRRDLTKGGSRPRLQGLDFQMRSRYLVVDGHSVIFAWPDLRKLHERRTSLAREALIKRLRDYQDRTGIRVVVVFDGKGEQVTETAHPGDVHIFYSRRGQTADAIVERLASKYAGRFDLSVATSDYLEQQTVSACGATCISPETLWELIEDARTG
jgi:uncharacterized protein